MPVALELKPCLPDVTVRMFCKLKLLCRIPIRPVNLAKIALNKWTAVYLYSSTPPPLYFIDRGELLEMYFTSTRQHVVSARERRFRVIRVGSTLIKEQTGSFLCLNPATVPGAFLRAGIVVPWRGRGRRAHLKAPARGKGAERGGSGATGSFPHLARTSRAHETQLFYSPHPPPPPCWWVTARPDFGFICLRFFLGGGVTISGEEAVRDERCFWQGVCSFLVSPKILDLVRLHPALTVGGGMVVVVGGFSPAVL